MGQNDDENSFKQQDIDLTLPTSSGNLDEEEDLYSGNSNGKDDPLGKIDVFIPGSSGIPEWVSHRNIGSEVRIELPMNWNEDSNFLGFALFFHLLSHHDDDDELVNRYVITQECKLTISYGYQSEMVDSISLDSFCDPYSINSTCLSSDPALRVIYFPQIAIRDHFRSWKNFKAHLDTPFVSVVSCQCGKNRAFKVESCGIHLIYAQENHRHNQNQQPQLVRGKTGPSRDDTDDGPQHKRSRHL